MENNNNKNNTFQTYQTNCSVESYENQCTDGLITLERSFNNSEESDLKLQCYNTKSNSVQQVKD